MGGGGDFDPLVAPGMGRSGPGVVGTGHKPGSIVQALMGNAAFFTERPKGNADASKLLDRGTEMKVISDDGSYVKVELNSGEVGYVPSVLVGDPASMVPEVEGVPTGTPGEFQVYPPLPGTVPVETIPLDPNAPVVPPEVAPDVAPGAPVPVEPSPAEVPVPGPDGVPVPPPVVAPEKTETPKTGG